MFSPRISAGPLSRAMNGAPPAGGFARLRLALRARAQRDSLRRLDDRMLDDIGVTRAEAAAEIARPLWDVPVHWLR